MSDLQSVVLTNQPSPEAPHGFFRDKKWTLSYLSLLLLTLASVMWFSELERVPEEVLQVPIWDWGTYRSMAEQFSALPNDPWQGVPTPWNSRVLLPMAWSLLGATGSGIVEIAWIVGVAGSLTYLVLAGAFLRRHIPSARLWFAVMTIILISPAFPLRQTLTHPLTGIWLEAIAAIGLAWLWFRFRSKRVSVWLGISILGLTLVLSIAREFFFYGLVVFLIVAVSGLLLRKVSNSSWTDALSSSTQVYGLGWLASSCLLSGLGRWLVNGAFPPSSENPFQTPASIVVSMYRWSNLVDLATGVFIAGGAFVLLYFLTSKNNSSSKPSRDLLLPSLLMLGFALAGGTDLDRFLVWGAPVFVAVVFSRRRLVFVSEGHIRGRVVAMITGLSILLVLRPVLPAVPAYALVESNQCGVFATVDFNPSRAAGLSFGHSQPPVLVEASEIIEARVHPESALISNQALEQCGRGLFFVGSRLGLNNVPLFFGFANNQHELLTLHPFHGDWKSKLPFVAQWLVLLIGLAFGKRPTIVIEKVKRSVSKLLNAIQ